MQGLPENRSLTGSGYADSFKKKNKTKQKKNKPKKKKKTTKNEQYSLTDIYTTLC